MLQVEQMEVENSCLKEAYGGVQSKRIKKKKEKTKFKTQSICFAGAAPKLYTALLYVYKCVCVRDSSLKLASSSPSSCRATPPITIYTQLQWARARPKAKAIRAQISNKSAQNQQQQQKKKQKNNNYADVSAADELYLCEPPTHTHAHHMRDTGRR